MSPSDPNKNDSIPASEPPAPRLISSIFALAGPSVEEAISRVNDSTSHTVHSLETIHRNLRTHEHHGHQGLEIAAASKSFDEAIDSEGEDTDAMTAPVAPADIPAAPPAPSATAAAGSSKRKKDIDVIAAPLEEGPLPDLTNEYLDRLIGWYRQKDGTNPRSNSMNVWIKTEADQWYKSARESWSAINESLVMRKRNVETQERTLLDYIHTKRLNLTRTYLTQLLNWYSEKNGDLPKRTRQDVWIKTDDGRWDRALFRWSEVEREFSRPDVRTEMGANSLEEFKNKHRAAAIDALVARHQAQPTARLG